MISLVTKRPLFVTVLSMWLMIGGLLSPLFLIGSNNSELADRLVTQPNMGLWSFVAQHSGALGVALFGTTLMLVPGVVGFGLWRMRTWARTATIVISVVNVLWGTTAVIRTFLLPQYGVTGKVTGTGSPSGSLPQRRAGINGHW